MNKRQFIFKEMNRKTNLTEQKLPAGWLSQHHKVICGLLQEKRHEELPLMLDPTGHHTRWSNSGIAVTGVSNCSELPQRGSRACYYKSGRKPMVWENRLLLFCWMFILVNGFLRIRQMPRINDCWMLSPKWNIYVTPSSRLREITVEELERLSRLES